MVVDVMCRCDFQTTGTELNVNIAVFYHRYLAVYKRYDYMFALEPCVLGVVRINAHGRITHDRFRTRCGYNRIFSRLFHHHVTEIVQLAVLFLINYFFIA